MSFVHSANGKVAIRGKILNYDGKSVVYYHPTIEGVFTPYWKEVKPSASGTFLIEFENKGIGTTVVGYKRLQYRFFHDENSTIYIELDESRFFAKDKAMYSAVYYDSLRNLVTVRITGDHQTVNRFYNQIQRTTYETLRSVEGNYYGDPINKAKTPKEAVQLIDSLIHAEKIRILNLPLGFSLEDPNLEKKNKEIRDFLINEMHAFYGTVFISGMFMKRATEIRAAGNDSTKVTYEKYGPEWERLIEYFMAKWKDELRPSVNSKDYNEFIESYSYTKENYKRYHFPQTTSSLDSLMIGRFFKTNKLLDFDSATTFAYRLSGMQLYLQNQLFYSPALLNAIYDLEEEYKGSQHMMFYRPQIEKLKAYVQAESKSFNKAKIINKNFSSFSELLKGFEGKNILIDVWATWCHPCIEDFRHKANIEHFIDSGRIELLYISIDKKEWNDRWRQSIKFNQLAGYHFRGDVKFIEDMWKTIGGYQGAIPRYVLIDSSGKIFKSTASRPGQGDALIKEIESLITK